jgi:phosphatidylglycerophosphate synthase
VVATGAAACFLAGRAFPVLLLLAALLCLARLWLNMLDGMVALAGGTASRRGEIFNELPDRLSDVLVCVGVAHSGLAIPALGYWAAILALLTAYVGTLGQAVAGRREYGGVMSKQWRMFALALAAIVSAIVLIVHATPDPIATARLAVNATLVLVIAGCVQTACVRLAATFRRIGGDAGAEVRRVT